MQYITIDKITAFASLSQPIDVYAMDGRGVYTHPNTKGEEVHFNLPQGEYETESDLTELPYPLEYICPELPNRVVYRSMKHMLFIVAPNPHLCSIHFAQDKKATAEVNAMLKENPGSVVVEIDPVLAKSEIPFLEYILFHEQGHFYYGGAGKQGTKKYYKIENYCDIFAAKEMMTFGFNPSQCYYACELSLSERPGALWRKYQLGKWLSKVVTIDKNNEDNNMEHYAEYFDRSDTPTNYTIERHNKETPVVKISVSGKADMTGQSYYPKAGAPLYAISGNEFTEHAVLKFDGSEPIKVLGVYGVENQIFHPSTWSQSGNIFILTDGGYLHFGDLNSNPIDVAVNNAKKGFGKIITTLLLVGLTAYIIHEVLNKK